MNPDRYENLPVEDFSGGLKENSPAGKNPPTHFIRFKNARVLSDKISVRKRGGMAQFDSSYSFGSVPVLGAYGIYEDAEVKTLACLPSALQLKAGGAWGSIFTPTKAADLQVSVCQYMGVTFVGGYEDVIAVLNGDADYAGVAAPTSTPTVGLVAASGTNKVLENPTANLDHAGELRAIAGNTILAMSFRPTEDIVLTKVVLSLRKIGAPTGNLWVEIHSAQAGTSGTKNASTNIVGQGSDNLDVSTLTAAYASKDLSFSGTAPSLTAYQTYFIMIYGSFTVSTTNFVEVGTDLSSPTYGDGQYWQLDASFAWTGHAAFDIVFEIWATGGEDGEKAAYGAVATGYYTSVRSAASVTLAAETFQVAVGAEISSIQLAVMKKCFPGSVCPTGTAWVEIHSSRTGTSLTKNASANIVGQASDSINLTSIARTEQWLEFTFSGTKPDLTALTDYYIVLYVTCTISLARYIRWTRQMMVVPGSAWEINGSLAWTSITNKHSYKVFGTDVETKVLEYATSNVDEVLHLRQDNAVCIQAQAFELSKDEIIEEVKLYLAKVGAPTGNLWAEIHSSQGGTSATKDLSTNIVGAATANLDVTTIGAFPTYAQHTLAFATHPELVGGRTYYLMVYCSSTVSATAYIKVARSFVELPIVGGVWQLTNALVWSEKSWMQVIFELWATIAGIPGTRKYVVTYYRGGNYPVESNPSPESLAVEITTGYYAQLTNIPISPDSRVTTRKIYRTEDDGETFYYLAVIENNTTTTFDDTALDLDLGDDEVEYDNDRPPAALCIESWDGRTWISDETEYLYPSKAGKPEQFDITAALALREKEASAIMRIKEFQNDLAVLKRTSIWCVQRSGSGYIADKVVSDVGIGARNTAVEAAGLLIFLSNNKKIEIFDGKQVLTPRVSDAVAVTLKSINAAFMYRSVAEHYVPDNEYRLAVPTGDNEWPDTVIVFDYARGTFAVDVHDTRKISSISVTDVDVNIRAMAYGTSEGELLTVDEEATDDAGVPITMDIQTAWFGEARFRHLRRLYVDYALDESLEATLQIYSNFENVVEYEKTLTGNTPAGDDPLLRDTIQKALKMNVQGSFFSFRFLQGTSATRFILSRLRLILRRRLPRGDIQAA